MIVQLFKPGDRVRDKYDGREMTVVRYHDEREKVEMYFSTQIAEKDPGSPSPLLFVEYLKDGKLYKTTTTQQCLELIV